MEIVSVVKSLFFGYGHEVEKQEANTFKSRGFSIGEAIRFNANVVKITGLATVIAGSWSCLLGNGSSGGVSGILSGFSFVCCTSALKSLHDTLEVWKRHSLRT